MKSENSIDFNNISLILNTLKNMKKQDEKEDKKEDNLLMKSYNNTAYIKNILPLITDDNENIYRIISCLEINQLVTNYKKTYQTIDKEKVIDLKKEAFLYIKSNLNEKNKHMADLALKFIEIKEIMNKNYKRGVNNGL
ncbi:hypothetical protein [uncultured Tyzzerella sp.]|uniref:hypothetical protein n=1 Tax=uncultured Tyzzerella sp. TaxID=2321398 RepID=UPI0029439FB2|nr:hypothetical protein [uncultured Tyzzerella sp.]